MQHIPKPTYVSDDEHSKYGPSGSKRWIQCPASIQMIDEINRPEGKPNFYAEEGTCAHELAAYCLDEEIAAETQIGKTFNDIIVDKEMARQVQKYIDYVNGVTTWDSTLWVENRLSLEHIEDNMFGTADAIVVSETELEIIDLKYGKGVVVEAENNTQLMLYAIGALTHLHKHGITFDPSFDVKLTIAQPRAPHADGPIRSTYITVAQLKDIQKMAKAAVVESKGDNPSFGPGEDQCRWCEAAPICKAYSEYNLNIAMIEFSDFKAPPRQFKNKLVNANTLNNKQVSEILKHTKSIEQWLKGITEYAIEQLKQNKPIDSFKLVYGRSNRAWKDADKVLEDLLEYGTDEKRLFKSKMLSVAQMEKELTEEEWKIVESQVFKPTGNITIAPETDKRMAINPEAEAIDDWGNEDI